MRNHLLNNHCPKYFASVSSMTPIVRDLVYKLSPHSLLLNEFAAFSTFPRTIFLKHFCSVSVSLYFSPFSLLHFTYVLSEPSYSPPPSTTPQLFCISVSFSFWVLYLVAFHVSMNKVNRIFLSTFLFSFFFCFFDSLLLTISFFERCIYCD